MYHYRLHPQAQHRSLTRPCPHHHDQYPPEPSRSSSVHTKKLPRLPVAAPVLPEGEPVPERPKTYAMPWQTCSVCPRYPFPSALLLDPPALWQPYHRVSPVTTSRTSLPQYPQSPPPDTIPLNQKNLPNDPSPGISRTQLTRSIDGEHSKHTRNTSRGRGTTTLYHVPLSRCPHSRPRPSKAQALARRTPVHVRLA